MYKSGNWQIRRSDSDSENQAEEKNQEIMGETWSKGWRLLWPYTWQKHQEIYKLGDQEIKPRKNIRKSGERDVKGWRPLWPSRLRSSHFLLCSTPLLLLFHTLVTMTHWSAQINNSLPLKPDFNASLNKFVVGPVACLLPYLTSGSI